MVVNDRYSGIIAHLAGEMQGVHQNVRAVDAAV